MERHQVLVVGPRKLQKELMMCRIQCQTGLRCTCLEREGELHGPAGPPAGTKNLVLLDVQGLGREALMDRLGEVAGTLPDNASLAVYNMDKDSGSEAAALAIGVRGFFYEDDCADCLVKGITNLFEGDVWVSRKKMVEYLLNSRPRDDEPAKPRSVLSRREKDILRQLGKGATNDEIAGRLCISPHTVRTHVYNIFKKIHVSNRLQASLWAAENLTD